MNDRTANKGGANARWVSIECQKPIFWEFLSETFREIVQSERQAVNVVKHYAGVESRTEFDNDSSAAQRLFDVFRRPFADFMQRTAAHEPGQHNPA